MANLVHRCLVCDPPHHAQLWATTPDVDEDTITRIITTAGHPPVRVRQATAVEAAWLAADPAKKLWVSQHVDNLDG